MQTGVFLTKLKAEGVFDILVMANIISETMDGRVEFQLRALAWYFSSK